MAAFSPAVGGTNRILTSAIPRPAHNTISERLDGTIPQLGVLDRPRFSDRTEMIARRSPSFWLAALLLVVILVPTTLAASGGDTASTAIRIRLVGRPSPSGSSRSPPQTRRT